ncbi:MAG TPA: proline racemase, partial [Planctomycetes bacterium]|nr:proline racemase [Planctomycetota bacterium]
MLQFSHVIQAVDSHTAAEPTRVITGGLPMVRGATMADKCDELKRLHDPIRRSLVLEPRGHAAIILAYLLPPTRDDADLGVVFANDAGYLGMCGHGAIGLATTAVAMGLVPTVEPVTEIVLDTPVGLVKCRVAVEGGRPKNVTITNVPSFLYRQRVVVDVHGFGKVAADIAYGGNWFAFVEADQLGLVVEKAHISVLMQA